MRDKGNRLLRKKEPGLDQVTRKVGPIQQIRCSKQARSRSFLGDLKLT